MNLPEPKMNRKEALNAYAIEKSDYAKEQFVLNNKRLVGNVIKSLGLNVFDDDLYATGLVGLVKAVNTFDQNKGVAFSSYATRVIRNEILMLFKKERIVPKFSLDETCDLGNGEQVSYADMIADERRFEEEVIADMQFEEMFDFLSEREKRIILLRMEGKKQKEIEKICGISQAQVSRIIKGACKKWRAKNGL